MRSFRSFGSTPRGVPIPADLVLEAHAARLLVLLSETSKAGRISGLTKLAKLDFFLRYPEFLARITGKIVVDPVPEPTMIRFHYGPWDPRYYQVLPYLESRGLIVVAKRARSYEFSLTDVGRSLIARLREEDAFAETFTQARVVGVELGRMTGNQLKDLVYSTFQDEVSSLALGEDISHAE